MTMKKTLVLVVDRDDDFGVKGNVDTPVIGIQECYDAAAALGSADPEDSDINALYAAINIYKEMKEEGADEVEVALICGNEKVGYRSDAAVVNELEEVLNTVNPGRIILVGDGAEDEYVYPIISSRVPIDSVKKVYVKQSPGLEGTVYIFSKMLSDPAKRKRFLAPIGWILVLISLPYILIPLFSYFSNGSPMGNLTSFFVIFLIGLTFVLYAYNIEDKYANWRTKWVSRMKRGSVTVTFALISVIFVLTGVVLGYYSMSAVYLTGFTQAVVWFLYNALWLVIFAVLIYMVGGFVDGYISTKTIKLSFIVGSLNMLSTGLLVTGALDILISYMGINSVNSIINALEIVAGISLAFISAFLQLYIRKVIKETDDRETDTDAVQ